MTARTTGWLSSLGIRTISSTVLIAAVILGVVAPLGPYVAMTTLFVALGLWHPDGPTTDTTSPS